MCGKNSTTTSTSTPNPVALGAYNNILGQAQNVAQLPFQQYGGEFVAPLTQQEQLAGQNINANAGFAQPYIQQAASYANAAAQPITAQQIQNYENPYINQVVGATEAQFNQQNAQQQQQLTGNAAAQDALGGNRVGLAQAALAGQQQTQEAPVIAGLYSQGYSQAEQEALAEQQQQAQAAYSLGNLGVAGQNAALQGAGAQLGYGQLGQQTQQALDTALYNQFLAQQGYPFQTLGWEAGLATGVGSQMGGTNVTQGPQPNPLSQYGGLALAGVGLLSDRDAKTDITKIGELKDGQSIYRYRYKGDPKWQIGLVAQNVERRHPEAVHREPGFGGLRSIDVKAATDEAAHRDQGGRIADCGRQIAGFAMGGSPPIPRSDPRFERYDRGGVNVRTPESGTQRVYSPSQYQANQRAMQESFDSFRQGLDYRSPEDRALGGPIAGFAMGGTPYSSLDGGASAGYVPTIQITPGNTMPKGPGGSSQQQQTNPIQQANSILGLNKSLSNFGSTPIGKFFGNMDVSTSDAQLAGMQSGLDPSEVGLGDADAFRSGGRIAGFAAGGGPTSEFADGGGPDDDSSDYAAFGPRSYDFGTINEATGSVFNPSTYAPSSPAVPPEPAAGLAGPEYSPVSIAGGTAQPAAQSFTGNLAGDSAAPQPRPAPQRTAGVSWDHPTPASAYGYAPNLQTIETGGGHRATVNSQAAPAFKGFLNDLEKAGAPISDVGGYNPRNIAGTHTLSQHAFGNAIDIDQTGRNLVTPEMQAWRDAHPGVFSQLASKWGLTSGENWKNPDFGHVEWRGANGQTAGVGAPQAAPQEQAQAQKPQGGLLGFNPLGLSDNARMALVAAGLGMAASRSPYLGNAIGEGGLAGLQAYQAGNKREFDEKLARDKLDQAAKHSQQQLDIENKKLAQGEERLAQGKFQMVPGLGPDPNDPEKQIPGAYRFNTKTGEQEFVPGVNLTQKGSATSAASMSPQAIEISARQLINGDLSGLTNVGRGAQGSQLLAAIRSRAAELLTDPNGEFKYSPADAARYLGDMTQGFKAGQVGQSAGARTAATRAANLGIILDVANAAVPNALSLSDQVYRYTGFVPLDRLIQNGQIMTNDPVMNRFAVANLQLAESWAKAMNPTGVMRESDRDIALHMLSTAKSPEAYKAVVNQIKDNIDREMEAVRTFQRGAAGARPGGAPAAGAPAGGGADPLAEARAAISRGAPRDAVIQRLRQNGNDPTGL